MGAVWDISPNMVVAPRSCYSVVGRVRWPYVAAISVMRSTQLYHTTVSLLALFMAILIAANIIKYVGVGIEYPASGKFELKDLQSMVAIVAIMIGGILAYFRFVVFRALVRRADVAIDVASCQIESGVFQHVAGVTIKNRGSLHIWIKGIRVEGSDFDDGGGQTKFVVELPFLPQSKDEWVVDSGETDQALFHRSVHSRIRSSLYRVTVEDILGRRWHAYSYIFSMIESNTKCQNPAA